MASRNADQPTASRSESSDKRERFEFPLTPSQSALMRRTAALEGRTVSDYVIRSLQTAAQETIHRHSALTLSPRDSVAFVEALLSPPEPNDRLRTAAARHDALIGE